MNNIIERTWKQNSMVNIEDLRGMAFQSEEEAHTFRIRGVDAEGNAIALSGNAAGILMRPDHTDVALTCTSTGGAVEATLPAECYDVPGKVGITIFLTSDGQTVCIYAAIANVSRTNTGNVSPGTTADVVDLINRISAAVATIPADYSSLWTSLAPAFDASKTGGYKPDEFVTNNGNVYVCIVPHTGAWNANHFIQANIGNKLTSLNSELEEISEPSANLYNPETAVQGILNSSGGINGASTYADYLTTEYILLSGATYVTILGTKPWGIAFYTHDKTFIERLTSTSAQKDTTYATDRNGTTAGFMRVTWNKTNDDYHYAMVVIGNNLSAPYEPYGRTVILPKKIEDGFNEISRDSLNLYNPGTAVVGVLNSSGGINDAAEYANYRTSDYISLTGATYFSVLGSKPWGIALYTANRTFIERLTSTSAQKDTAYATDRNGTTAGYLRITWNTTSLDYSTAMVILGNNLSTPYEPYGRIVILPPNAVTDENIADALNKNGGYTANNFDPTFFPVKVRQAAWRGNTRSGIGEEIAPENSWAAYRNAVANGFDMLWIAVVQYSSSGKFYCEHDNEITINGVTDQFYNFTDQQIESYTLSDGSKIPVFEDVLKYCALNGMPVGIRMGRVPTTYNETTIGNTNLTRKAVWDSFIELIKRYNLQLNIFSGAESQCRILHTFMPFAHVQNTSNKSDSTADLLDLIQSIINVGSYRRSVNVYITNSNSQVILTEAVMQSARDNNVKVFAVTTEPVATETELNVIKNLCPDFIITHSKLNFDD